MVSKSDLKKPLSSLSKLRKEEVLKYKRAEELEKLDLLGQENEDKALPHVQAEVQKWEDAEKRTQELDFARLESLKGDKNEYLRELTRIFMRFVLEEDLPKKYQVLIDLTDKGIVIKLANTNYYGAFTPCGLVSYDRNYCKVLSIKLSETVSKLEGHYHTTESGIMIPDQEDLATYG